MLLCLFVQVVYVPDASSSELLKLGNSVETKVRSSVRNIQFDITLVMLSFLILQCFSADIFTKRLKTHLFRNALGHVAALEALRNALYKFKTYLLTYLLYLL